MGCWFPKNLGLGKKHQRSLKIMQKTNYVRGVPGGFLRASAPRNSQMSWKILHSKYETNYFYGLLAIYECLKRFNEALQGFIKALTGLTKACLDLLS